MPIVVSDTSPMRGLQCLELLGLLRTLFGEVLLPPEVARELNIASRYIGALDVRELTFCRVMSATASTSVAALRMILDQGETEALALALEVKADVVLMDDYNAREAAKRLGLRPMGLGGVLLAAKQAGLIAQVIPLILQVRDRINFTISPEVIEQLRRMAGE
jgi:predicted nucleic acid-binding protein